MYGARAGLNALGLQVAVNPPYYLLDLLSVLEIMGEMDEF